MGLSIIVRPEGPEDEAAVAEVNEDAFERPDEAAVVAALRRGAAFLPGLSLIAEVHDAFVGHILFTRLHVGVARSPGLALAPLAVRKVHQRRRIGLALGREGLRLATARGEAFAIVLGHPEYYPRFGFAPASRFGIRAPFEVRDEALMALELLPGGLNGVSGLIEWAPEFGLEISP